MSKKKIDNIGKFCKIKCLKPKSTPTNANYITFRIIDIVRGGYIIENVMSDTFVVKNNDIKIL